MAGSFSRIFEWLGVLQAPDTPERYETIKLVAPVAEVSVSPEAGSAPRSPLAASNEREPVIQELTAADPEDFEFDEEWYLHRYPDVAQAVRRHGRTGRDHYVAHGRAEGRRPVPPASSTKVTDRAGT
jgi:hypothetical protein